MKFRNLVPAYACGIISGFSAYLLGPDGIRMCSYESLTKFNLSLQVISSVLLYNYTKSLRKRSNIGFKPTLKNVLFKQNLAYSSGFATVLIGPYTTRKLLDDYKN